MCVCAFNDRVKCISLCVSGGKKFVVFGLLCFVLFCFILFCFSKACLRLGWFLSGGVDVLGHHSAQTLAEGIVDGLGIAMLVVCYLLCILLWLQVLNQITPAGERRSCCVQWRTLIMSSMIILYLVADLVVRIVWNTTDNPETVFISIAIYHVIVLLATLLCSVSFVVISVYLYRVLREVETKHEKAKQSISQKVFFFFFFFFFFF